MTIVKGDFGGMVFRVNSSGSAFYRFAIATDDTYTVNVIIGSIHSLLVTGDFSNMKIVLNQSYLITIIAQGSRFYLYIDKHYITDFPDTSNTLSSGKVGLTAGSSASPPTEVVFRNAQMWKL